MATTPATHVVHGCDDFSDDDDNSSYGGSSYDSSSSSSVSVEDQTLEPEDITVIGEEDDKPKLNRSSNRALRSIGAAIDFWRNVLLLSWLVGGSALTVLAYIALSNMDDFSEEIKEQVSGGLVFHVNCLS